MYAVMAQHENGQPHCVPTEFASRELAVHYVETMYFPLLDDGPQPVWKGNAVTIEDECGKLHVSLVRQIPKDAVHVLDLCFVA